MNAPVKIINCIQCGTCCLAGGLALINVDDINRWKDEFRHDILRVVENFDPIWVGDHIVNGATGRRVQGCPFLLLDDEKFSCSIYETRPEVCRNYKPGSSHICSQSLV